MECTTLLERAMKGDEAAFAQMVTQHHVFVYMICLSRVFHDLAHLRALPLKGEPHAVPDIFYYLFPHDLTPTFVVDISDHVNPWIEALQCHRSQFYNPHRQRYEAIDRFLAVARATGLPEGSAMCMPSSPERRSSSMMRCGSWCRRSVRFINLARAPLTPGRSDNATPVWQSCRRR